VDDADLTSLKAIFAAVSAPDDKHAAFRLACGNDALSIPSRIYQDEAELRALHAGHSEALDAVLTRHHDGFVRARALARILAGAPATWTLPFIIALVGEYVVEILQQIDDGFVRFDPNALARFVNDNPAFLTLLRQRVASYWDCYYRAIPRREYVGFRLVARLENLAMAAAG
jgi:hypothetical protein